MPARRLPSQLRKRRARNACSQDLRLTLALNAIEVERDNLSRADSLLGCLALAMEHGGIDHKGPYYPDVVQMAREIVKKSIGALDPIHLPDPSRDKVKEDLARADPAPIGVALQHVSLLPRQSLTPPGRFPLRIHRRDYSRHRRVKPQPRQISRAEWRDSIRPVRSALNGSD
jgi:hypothetical protein